MDGGETLGEEKDEYGNAMRGIELDEAGNEQRGEWKADG